MLTLLTGLLFGLAPALHASRVDLTWALKDRSSQPRGTSRWFNLRNMLVVTQVALSLVALVGAGLFLRSLQNAQKINPGFESRNVLMISFDLAGQRYGEARGREYFRQVTERVAAIPQVRAVGLASAPLFGGDIMRTVFAEGQDVSDRRNGRLTALLRVSPGYFDAIHMPIVSGRSFTERDTTGAPMVAVVNETMAARLWPKEEVLGKRFRCFGESWVIEVVGIARNAKYATLGEEPMSFMYFPLLQHYTPAATLHVRPEGDPANIIAIVRSQMQALDGSMPLVNVNTIGQVMEAVLWAPRMGANLLALFGFLALLLAAIGKRRKLNFTDLTPRHPMTGTPTILFPSTVGLKGNCLPSRPPPGVESCETVFRSASARYSMPELPDVAVYIESLKSRIAGEPLTGLRLVSPFLLRAYAPPMEELIGRRIEGLRRIGKRIVFCLEKDYFMVLHLMIAGRLHWKKPGGGIPGKTGLCAFDFPNGTLILTKSSTPLACRHSGSQPS